MLIKNIIKQATLKSEEAKKFFYEKDFLGIYMYDWLLMGASKSILNRLTSSLSHAPSFILMGAKLHLEINKIVAKQNTMVDGKYKKARLYVFETPSLYIAATCETGDRGSGWYVLKKSNLNNVKTQHYTDEIFDADASSLKELSQFMRAMCWNILENNQEYKKECTQENKRYESFIKKLEAEFGEFSVEIVSKKIKIK